MPTLKKYLKKTKLSTKDSIVSVIDIQKFIQEDNINKYEEIVILKFGKDGGYIGIVVVPLKYRFSELLPIGFL
jgi:hypothetical protein